MINIKGFDPDKMCALTIVMEGTKEEVLRRPLGAVLKFVPSGLTDGEDVWHEHENAWKRVHRSKRTGVYTLGRVQDKRWGPLASELEPWRSIWVSENGPEGTWYTDNWRKPAENPDIPKEWTGETIFYKKKEFCVGDLDPPNTRSDTDGRGRDEPTTTKFSDATSCSRSIC